jgi:hypothetical protein
VAGQLEGAERGEGIAMTRRIVLQYLPIPSSLWGAAACPVIIETNTRRGKQNYCQSHYNTAVPVSFSNFTQCSTLLVCTAQQLSVHLILTSLRSCYFCCGSKLKSCSTRPQRTHLVFKTYTGFSTQGKVTRGGRRRPEKGYF